MPAPSATISPRNWMTAPVNPAASPGWLSGALVPQFKTVDIVPRTRLRSGASTATAAVQRYGPQATSAAAPTRMNGPGGTVGNPSTPEKYSIVIPAAATTMPSTFTLAGVESRKSLPIINLLPCVLRQGRRSHPVCDTSFVQRHRPLGPARPAGMVATRDGPTSSHPEPGSGGPGVGRGQGMVAAPP